MFIWILANVDVPLNKNICYKNDLIKIITYIYRYLLCDIHSSKSTLCTLSQLFLKATDEVGGIIPHFAQEETKAQDLSLLTKMTEQVMINLRLFWYFSDFKNLDISTFRILLEVFWKIVHSSCIALTNFLYC